MQTRIYRLSAICAVLTALAFVVPRFVPNSEGGLAAAANAVMIFLGMLFGAALLAVYLLIQTLLNFRDLGRAPRIAGIAPAVILVTGFVLVLTALRY